MKERINRITTKIALWIYLRFIDKRLGSNSNLELKTRLQIMKPLEDAKQLIQEYYLAKIKSCIYIVSISFVFGLLALAVGRRDEFSSENTISKNEYGGREKKVDLEVEAEDVYCGEISLEIKERKLSKAETGELFEDIEEELTREFLGENESLDRIEHKVNLISELEDGEIQIEWKFDRDGIILKDGNLGEDIASEGELVGVSAIMTYLDYEDEFSFSVMVFPENLSKKDDFVKKLEKIKEEIENEENEENSIRLPSEVNGIPVSWKNKPDFSGIKFCVLGVILAAIYFIAKDRETINDIKLRSRQMEEDYPEIVAILSLYLQSGLSVRSSWERIVRSYLYKKKETGQSRYAYEEMCITNNQMQEGIGIVKALEEFGVRCSNPLYLKMSSLLIQNIKLGYGGVNKVFKSEMENSMEMRKRLAKVKSEEAGTKMLFPMIIQLMVVLGIIMAPAFMSFLG